MGRRYLRTYTGARTRVDLSELENLDRSRWVVQPKLDGMFAELRVGPGGKVHEVRSRTGRDVECDAARALIGCVVGYPGSILHGELEAHTSAGIAAAAARGYAVFHAFDAVQIGGLDIAEQPYRRRRHELLSMLGDVENWLGSGRDWTHDRLGRAHGSDGRFCRKDPRGWRRVREVPQYRLQDAGRLWEEAVDGDLEGLVAVALNAPVGRRRSKLKIKPVDYLPSVVESCSDKRVVVRLPDQTIEVVARGGWQVQPGDVVDLAHEGHYVRGGLRFARIESVRRDLAPAVVGVA